MKSVLAKDERKTFGPRFIAGWGKNAKIRAFVRYDDQCGNGHNTFSITGEISIPGKNDCEACGCLHEEIARVFPQLEPYIKWHLCSSDEPMHYVANSLYWAGKDGYCNGGPNDPPNLKHFRSTAIWPDATQDEMESVTAEILQARLAGLKDEFRDAVESLGFTY